MKFVLNEESVHSLISYTVISNKENFDLFQLSDFDLKRFELKPIISAHDCQSIQNTETH